MRAIGRGLTAYGSLGGSNVLASALLLADPVAAMFSPVVRLRRASGDERQQLKWFLYAAVPAALGVSMFLVEVMFSNYTITSMFKTMNTFASPWFEQYDLFYVSSYVPAVALLLLAVFACIAILRYRLDPPRSTIWG